MANEKHIFIGIGGSGCETVSQIKEKVYEKRFDKATATKTRLQAMNDSYRFLFIDTDQRDIDIANKRNRATFEEGKVPFISPQTDLINLGRANPYAIYYEATQDPNTLINKRILEACSSELAAKIPDQPLSFGAGAFRMKSRIAFAHSLTDFQSKVQAAISSLNDVKTVGGEDCIIYYWVVGSTLGGTGSGIFNDVLYHLNQIHHQVVGNGNPQLVLTMYMPKVYIDSNSTEDKYTLNAFGVFSELTAFKAMSYNEKQNTIMHRLAFQNDYTLIDSQRRYNPFYYLIPVDIQTDKGTSLGAPRTMYRNTAEMLYHLHYSKAGATFRSDIDNYMNDIMERNHKEFLVPMGYVSLQKPNEQFNKYMRFRLKRDILRSWLLCDSGKEAVVEESSIEKLYKELFHELDEKSSGTIASKVLGVETNAELQDLESLTTLQNPDSDELAPGLYLPVILEAIDSVKNNIEKERKSTDKRDEYKQKIIQDIWSNAERWVRSRGLTYAYNAVDEVRKYMEGRFNDEESKKSNEDNDLDALYDSLKKLFDKSKKPDFKEKAHWKSNKDDINNYINALQAYEEKVIKNALAEWSHDLRKDFCTDEKNDELSKLKKHLASFRDKVAEMNKEAVKQYDKLATDMGETALDVTTVYLPQLKKIADGNGWISDNIFSRLYRTIINAQEDEAETPERKELQKFVEDNIYNAVNEDIVQAIKTGQYQMFFTKIDKKTKKEDKTSETRYFCNPKLERPDEKVIKDFLSLAVTVLEKKMRESKDIQEKWDNKKISAFFADLTNEDKDDVRRSLNPALFFSYNANRIDVMKKEEHVVFVAGTEDLAEEMLGYQKGNPKHRFVPADDENTALVLKSKYGLSLADYRIYDSIKMVYDKATFREKYHFHHAFSQYLDKITLDNLPVEVLPQHRAFAKMLLLEKFREDTKPFFYSDDYDPDVYTDSMKLPDSDTSFKIAQPEAFYIHPKEGKIVLQTRDNERELYKVIEGTDKAKQFENYCNLYYNYRFGETTDAILQAILRQKHTVGDEKKEGDKIFKEGFTEKRKALLQELSDKKKKATPVEQRLYNVLFNIVRDEFDTVQKFIKDN